MRPKIMIYFDHASTKKSKKEVIDIFNKANENFANVHSLHNFGLTALEELNEARRDILAKFKLRFHNVIFTSSATEANNLAILGYCKRNKNFGNHIITSEVEHPSVLECFKVLNEEYGFEVTYLSVNKEGKISPLELEKAMKPTTILVSIIAINNETGSINDIEGIANVVHMFHRARLHVDTTQAIGKTNLDYTNIDMFVVSGHKIGGIKGSGCLIYRNMLNLSPIIYGGGQEEGLRSGTVAFPLAISLKEAIRLSIECQDKNIQYVQELNSYLRKGLLKRDKDFVINSPIDASPFVLSVSSLKKKAAIIVEALSNKNVYLTSVSACHSKKETFSYVIYSMFKDEIRARNTIRISLDETNTKEEIDIFFNFLDEIISKIK